MYNISILYICTYVWSNEYERFTLNGSMPKRIVNYVALLIMIAIAPRYIYVCKFFIYTYKGKYIYICSINFQHQHALKQLLLCHISLLNIQIDIKYL